MHTDPTTAAEGTAALTRPITLTGALRTIEAGALTQAAELRGSLARRDLEGAHRCFEHLRRLLCAHLDWEREQLPAAMGLGELMDLPGGTRPLRAWHELLLASLDDLKAELNEPEPDHLRSRRRAEHAVARLAAFVEDYAADLARGTYRTLDGDVEAHDEEALRRRALDAWFARIAHCGCAPYGEPS